MSHSIHPTSSASRATDGATESSPSTEIVFELLDDPHVRTILNAVRDEPRPARELVELCDGSRPTVYRRLDRLETAGLVETHTQVHPDGHHRKLFTSDVESISLELGEGGFTAAVRDVQLDT
jgi:DNA-binding transcriptional ArsR family regulator